MPLCPVPEHLPLPWSLVPGPVGRLIVQWGQLDIRFHSAWLALQLTCNLRGAAGGLQLLFGLAGWPLLCCLLQGCLRGTCLREH